MFPSISKLVLPLSTGLVTLLVCLLYLPTSFDFHHDGHMYAPAKIIASTPNTAHRHTATIYGFLTQAFHASLLHLFGDRLIYLKLSACLSYALTAGILTLIWRHFLSSTLTLTAFFLWLAFFPAHHDNLLVWPSIYGLTTQSAALLILLAHHQHRRSLSLAGIATGLTISFRLPVGLTLLFAVLLYFLILTLNKRLHLYQFFRTLLFLSLGLNLILLPQLIWLVINGSLLDWWQQTIIWPLTFAQYYSMGFPPVEFILHLLTYHQFLPSAFTPATHLFWFLLPINTLILFFLSLRLFFHQPSNSNTSVLLFISLVCLFSWAQYYPISEPRHYFWATSPMFGLAIVSCFGILQFFLRFSPLRKVSAVTASTLMLISTLFLYSSQQIQGLERLHVRQAPLSRIAIFQGLHTTPQEAAFLDTVTDILNHYFTLHPKKTYINFTHEPLYSSLHPNHANPHPMFYRWEFITSLLAPEHYTDIENYIATSSPLVFSDTPLNLTGYQLLYTHNSPNLFIYSPDSPSTP